MKVLQFSTTDAPDCMYLHLLRKLGTAMHATARPRSGVATSAATNLVVRYERKTGLEPSVRSLRVRDGGLDVVRRAA